MAILNRCESDRWQLINSDAIAQEVEQTPDIDKQRKVERILSIAKIYIGMNDQIETKAKNLIKKGFKIFDALHIASAESGNANIFLTTDDRLLRRARGDADIIVISNKNETSSLFIGALRPDSSTEFSLPKNSSGSNAPYQNISIC